MPRLWDAVDWARPRLGEQRAAGQGETHRQERTERLLTLVAFTSRIEPGLLRALRQLLPAGDADVGTEADVWNSPDVLGGLVSVAGLSSAVRTRYQMRFAALPDERKRQVVEVMRVWRAGLPKEIWLDEVLALEAGGDLAEGVLQAEELEAAHRLWRRMAATVEGAGSPPQEVVRAVQDFVREAIAERLPEAVWQDQELRPVLWRAWERSWKGEGLPALPKGADPAVLGGGEEGPIRGMVFQIGHGLQWYPAREERSTGSPLGEVESANRLGTLQGVVERLPSPRPLGGEAFLPLPAGSWAVLRTDRVEATFVRFDPPPWATALGRDRIGLWAAFEVEGVEQRLRWIPPGRFWMGSPEGEPGRWEDEGPRHLESIPQGFWLAETPCTQALWEAVMEHNPSRFQSEDHPVEQVSWNDCQEFLSRLNGRIEGLDVRLPQENEWEYACRAGTETATYAGAMKIRGNYDAPVLEEIAWYGGNSEVDGQKGTRPVATKRPNPWGLYDMLGNVNEWCTDAWRFTYDAPYGGSNRVCRGGSWYSYARVVRAAYRTHYSPSNRWRDLGFRLARGQGALELAEPEQGAERPGDGEAERGTRRSRRPSRPEAAWR